MQNNEKNKLTEEENSFIDINQLSNQSSGYALLDNNLVNDNEEIKSEINYLEKIIPSPNEEKERISINAKNHMEEKDIQKSKLILFIN